MAQPLSVRTIGLTVCVLICCGVGWVEAADITIRTDHPQYPGEGAFQTIEDCVRFATAHAGDSDQDRAIAMYKWLLTHQWHLMSPQEWCVPGRQPDTQQTSDYEMVVYDANRSRFSYGYGLCGTVHSWNEPYWKALGLRARRRAFPGHVNSEIFYGGSWHAFDTDMAGLLFRQDGIVAGYDDVVRNPGLVDSVQPPVPHYPFDWPNDFNTMKAGWQQVAKGGHWYSMYNGGYALHPGIVDLRSGESLTRWFDRDHFGGPGKRRYWHNQAGGPHRNWAFFDAGEPVHNGRSSNSRNDVNYCNGEFIYQPDLRQAGYREAVTHQTRNVGQQTAAPHLYSVDQQSASVTFSHFSPYVICGDPVDDVNPMTGLATDGLIVNASFVGDVVLEVSANQGQTWHTAIPAAATTDASQTDQSSESVRYDLTEYVKGRYGWQIRFSWSGAAGINRLQFTTTTQVSQAIYPFLTPDGCDVNCRVQNRSVVAVLPDLGLSEDAVARYEVQSMRSDNVRYQARSEANRRPYETTNNKPGQVVFRVAAPDELLEVRAAVRYQVRVPPPEGCDYHMDISTDNGQTWQLLADANIPADNEYSSGWLSGTADVASRQATEALVRVHFYAGGHRTGLIDAQLYGIHKTRRRSPVDVTFGWLQGDDLRTHSQQLDSGADQTSFRVPTGTDITNSFIRMDAR